MARNATRKSRPASVPDQFDGNRAELLGRERVWGPTIVVVAIVTIQMALPDSVTIGPRWLIPAAELLGILVLRMLWSFRPHQRSTRIIVSIYKIGRAHV